MNKQAALLAIFILVCLLHPALLPARQEDHKPLKEFVEVTNVEVIVRAVQDGKPVPGLKAEDFSILENGKNVRITSFTEFRQKIGRNAEALEQTAGKPEAALYTPSAKKRLFILYFWVTHHKAEYKKMLDYFFDNIYSEGDRVLLALKNQVFDIKNNDDIWSARDDLESELEKLSTDIQADLRAAVNRMDGLIREISLTAGMRGATRGMMRNVISELKFAMEVNWQEFVWKHLTSNTEQMIELAGELDDVYREKWGMVFYQQSSFPLPDLVRIPPQLSWLRRLVHHMLIKLRSPQHTHVYLKKIKQAYVSGDATFHVLWVSPDDTFDKRNTLFKMEKTYSGWMELFKGISKVTGGEVLKADKLEQAMEKVMAKEDIFYRITYAPRPGKKIKRKLSVKSKRKGIKIYHQKRIRVEGQTRRLEKTEII